MEVEMLFVGYNDFISKKNDKHYNVLKFLTSPKFSNDGTKCDVELISVFVEEDSTYRSFVKDNKIMSRVPVKVLLNGTSVRYTI